MNLNAFKKKTIMIPAVAVAIVAVGGGSALAVNGHQSDQHDQVTGATRDKVAAAAIALVGEGATVTDIETEDKGGAAYDVELTTKAGVETEIKLDKDLNVVAPTAGAEKADRPDRGDRVRTVGSILVEDTDRAITDAEVQKIAAAATAVAPGTVIEIESDVPDKGDTGTDAREVYDVKILGANGLEYDVTLDASFTVITHSIDD